ncbi:MAG: NUDIX hydrolase [Candidatus Paceibacterota bacterium]|jgi:8-oxo-dGTP pyrophosphatase MutT (NUDIX family)
MNNLITEKVVISNPIGNLYRKRHVLVLVIDKDSNFILGKKKGFYPDHVARMLGGGIEENEDPKIAAKREIEEELLVNISVESFNELCSVVTQASTSEGYMEMQTWIYSVRLPNLVYVKPSDDITGIQVFTLEQYENLVKDIEDLSGEFVTDKFSFFWADWGKIYGPIHKYALELFREIRNQ